MRLNTYEWGTGDRIVVLVHGLMSDHRTWRRVAPALVDKGYRVIGVDLRGHGASGRGAYDPEYWADDLVETLPRRAELAIGHSLGGMALALAAGRLLPERAIYYEPAWTLRCEEDVNLSPRDFKTATREVIVALAPGWEKADIDVELATIALWDPKTAEALLSERTVDVTPPVPEVPSLVLTAGLSRLLPTDMKRTLSERGFVVRTVEGAGHTIHRDDFDRFMASLNGWI